MPTTQQLRDAWNPVCQIVNRKQIVEALQALDDVFKKYGYRPKEGETWGYNCRKITGGSGYSLHSYRSDRTFTFWTGVKVTIAIAVDINSKTNPYGPNLKTDMPMAMIQEIYQLRTNSGHQVWGWGGFYSKNKDAMHFELNCFPDQLATGLQDYPAKHGSTAQTEATVYAVTYSGTPAIWATDGVCKVGFASMEELNAARAAGIVGDTKTLPQSFVDRLVTMPHLQDLLQYAGDNIGGLLSDTDVNRIAEITSDHIAHRIES